MKTVRFIFLFVFVLAPILILGYQNCSNVGSSGSNNRFPEHLPIKLNSVLDLGYAQGSCLPSTLFASVELYSETAHLCVIISDTCESAFLAQSNFAAPSTEICKSAISINSPSLVDSFTTASVTDFGYTADAQVVCTFQFERLVNVKFRKCVDAANGCEIQHLKTSQGFTSDIVGFCS